MKEQAKREEECPDKAHLIEQVRGGDEQAFSQMLALYRPLLEASVRRFSQELLPEEQQDLRQEATLVFYHAILNYDMEQSEVEFGLYAKICVTNALVSQLRLIRRRRVEESLDGMESRSAVLEENDPAVGVLEEERLRELYAVIRKHLSPFEYRVWRLYVSGMTAKDVARAVGKDERSVGNAIYRIRQKLRALLRQSE
ncbi:MAG: sigma-70 family RNA polymerase sigma factor [Ruminococcaceae bacterium]|nr:sigma-70 family RNA polymerase sigma factor [Oscillospiraceae bacterium]